MKKKHRHILIDIHATFGSDFQEETSMKVLELMLQAWTVNVDLKHKSNMVLMDINQEVEKIN